MADLKAGTNLVEVADSMGGRGDKTIIAARIGESIVGLATVLTEDSSVEFLTFDSPEARDIYRHTASHVMAQAVKTLYPDAKLGIGPAIESGFYYDFDAGGKLTDEDLPKIENIMRQMVKQDFILERTEMPRDEAVAVFSEAGESYKVELLKEMKEATVSIYRQGGFADLCRGPHLPSTGRLKAFKLTSLAGAYWHGDETKPMLQRIYGTAFDDDADLKQYLDRLEEAKARDHRRLGTDLDLFSIHEEAGAGLAYWHPKGSVIRRTVEDFWMREHEKRGYSLVYTPHIARARMWEASGHLEYYKENMYVFDVDNEQYVLKPMNCVGHILIYKSRKRSYRDLPIRMAELGTVHRKERSGTLHGLMRVRGFTQDDAHIFCTRDQIVDEVVGVIELAQYMLSTFGFKEYQVDLSVRDPEKPGDYAGADDEWADAEGALAEALRRKEIPFTRKEGEAVFYGPKIDIKLLDALGRGWQGPTIQFDFNLPGRLGVEYVGQDGHAHNVVMIHRTVLGAMGRFVATVLEHYAGALPVWLAPVQASVLPVLEKNEDYAAGVLSRLMESGVRAELVGSQQKLGYRIRSKTLEKVPYILVVGDKEAESGGVAVRKRKVGDQGIVPLDEFVDRIRGEIDLRSIED
ncbi:MAG: threonine--tRNA ligase [Candidatus Eisenbacteria bacterium]